MCHLICCFIEIGKGITFLYSLACILDSVHQGKFWRRVL